MEDIDINLIKEIAKYKLNEYEFNNEYEQFSKAYLSVYNYDKNVLKESNDMIISLNEIDKYIKLRKVTYNKIDLNIILSFIFVFRYFSNEIAVTSKSPSSFCLNTPSLNSSR